MNYKNLLKLTGDNGCIENYNPCQVDTFGNLLCIDENFDCPINKMKVDSISRAYDYLNKYYNYAPLSNLSYNNRFFYSNDYPDGNVSVIIVKSENEPEYLIKKILL